MSGHVRELLARSFEEDLSTREREWIDRHIAVCSLCAQLKVDLETTSEDLERLAPATGLPAFASLSAPAQRHAVNFAAFAVTAVGLAGLIVTLSVLTGRAPEPVSSSASSPPTSASNTRGLELLVAHHLVLGSGPGGTPTEVTDAFDSLSLVRLDGSSTNHAIGGVAASLSFDGERRVAYWAREGLNSGSWRLALWDAVSRDERVLLTLGGERPAGGIIWTADRNAVITHVALAGDRVRMLRVDQAGKATTIRETSPDGVVAAIYGDNVRIFGFRGARYVTLDAQTGALVAEAAMRQPAGEITANASGVVFELVRPFENETGPLRVWRISNPPETIAMVEDKDVETPVFWPGRTEIAFARGLSLYAVDYATSRVRTLASLPEPPRLVGFDPSGDTMVVRTNAGYEVFLRVADSVRPTAQRFTGLNTSLFKPLGILVK